MSALPTTIQHYISALAVELLTAAHSPGDGLTLLAATRAAERHLSDALQTLYDAHDAALGITPTPLAAAPAEARRAA